MYKSLRSRVLLVVGSAVLMTVISTFFLAQREMERVVTTSEEQHARDLLDAVRLSVETEYESLVFHRETTLDRRKTELKNIVTLAFSHLDVQYRLFREDRTSTAQAQQAAIQAVRQLRYDDGIGYIWINDLEQPIPTMIMHPTLPELDGRRLDDPTFNTAQGRGENLFTAAVDVCLKDGEGFVDYLWPKPTRQGLTSEQPKISYVRLFREWGWVLGTGVYIDDIEIETARRRDAIVAELNKIFAKVRFGETGYMFLFTGQGEMLVHPNLAGAEFATLKNPATGRLFFEEFIAASKTPGRYHDYTWDKPGQTSDLRFPKRAFMTHFEPLDWYIGASMYLDELNQPGKTLRNRTFLLALLPLATALLIAFALARGMTRPLRKLAQSAKSIAQNGLSVASIPISGPTETRELGQVLDQMVHSLRKAEEELRAANWELEAFVGTVSHDLRSPLTPIIGYAQYLQEEYKDQLDEQALDCLKEIETQGERMIEQMEDMLTLAKAGYLERPAQPVATDEVVKEAIADLVDEISQSGVDIKLSHLPPVSIPASLLSQVFANLIGNAIRYAGLKGSPIEIGGERDHGLVRYFVRDHGPGVPEHEREEIFLLFQRGSTGRQLRGTGMGLAIVEKVAKTYGGRAWVEATPGGGSTFLVELAEPG